MQGYVGKHKNESGGSESEGRARTGAIIPASGKEQARHR